MEKNSNDIINEFCYRMAADLLNRSKEPGEDVWPQPIFAPGEGVYFCHQKIISDLHILFKSLKQKGLTQVEIANLFLYPSRALHLLYLFLEKPYNKFETKSRTEVAKEILECINILRNGDLFCLSGKNSIWSHEKISNIILKSDIKKVESFSEPDKIKELISKNIIALSCFCEFLYFANVAFGREIHGPYYVKNVGHVLVREYFDLKPPFWNFSQKLPFTSVRLITIYPSLNVRFDIAGRIYTQQALGRDLSGFYIEIDGKPLSITIETLEQMLQIIKKIMDDARIEIKKLTKVELMKKFINGYFWILKPLKEQNNLPWEPSKEFYERITVEVPQPHHVQIFKNLENYDEKERLEIVKKLFDPRVSYDEIEPFIKRNQNIQK